MGSSFDLVRVRGHSTEIKHAGPPPSTDRGAAGYSTAICVGLLLIGFSPLVAAAIWTPKSAALLVMTGMGFPVLCSIALRPADRLGLILLAWVGWAWLSAAWSEQPMMAVLGPYNWGTGALYVAALAASFALGSTANVTTRARVRLAVIAGAAVNGAIALVQQSGIIDAFPFEPDGGRASGLLGNPVHLGAIAAAAVVLVATDHGARRVPSIPAVVLLGSAVHLSGSRAALLLLGAVAAILLVRRRWVETAIVAAALVGGLGIVGLVPSEASGEGPTAAGRLSSEGGDIAARTGTWMSAQSPISSRPLVGFGPGRFAAATLPERTLSVARAEGPDRIFIDAHNIFVEYFVTTGIVGGGLLVASLAVAIWRGRGPWLWFALVLGAAHLVQPQSVGTTPLLFLGLGLSNGRVVVKPARSSPVSTPARALTTAVAVVAAGTLLIGDYFLNEARLDVLVSDAHAAERLLPRWPQPARRLATAYELRSKVEERPTDRTIALSWLQEAATRAPHDPGGWIDLAEEQAVQEDFLAAEQSYRRALAASRYSVRALNGLGRALEAQGKAAAAAEVFRRSLKISPCQSAARSAIERLRREVVPWAPTHDNARRCRARRPGILLPSLR